MNSLPPIAEIIKTEDGSDTLYVAELDEHYHSVHGAIKESEFIFLNAGFDFSGADPVRIFEAGFGTGLNVLLTALRSLKDRRKVHYSTIEKFPLSDDIINSLNYKDFVPEEGKRIYEMIHSSEWNIPVKILDNFTLVKISGDLTSFSANGNFDLIYFDAFGPDKQPEIWSDKVFEMIADHTVQDGVFITYSAKGEVKRRLVKYGFKVTILQGPPGKRHILRAVKI